MKTIRKLLVILIVLFAVTGMMPTRVHAESAASYGPETGVKDVCVFLPYDGTTHNNFARLEHVGEEVAAVTGGELLCYKGTEATIDRLAAAVESCAVVIIGSHGNSGTFGLTTDAGLTEADYAGGHARDDGESYKNENGSAVLDYHLYTVDGTTIAAHMSGNAPGNLIVFSSCEGMKTDRFQAPLRDKGVSVVFGFSESVSCYGDTAMSSAFLSLLCEGKPVCEAFRKMKEELGQSWDAWQGNYTFEEAQQFGIAFPIVVSAEDPYPGTGNVNIDQVSNSPWKLPVRTDIPEKHILALNTNQTYTIAEARDQIKDVTVAAGEIPSGMKLSVSGNRVILSGTPDRKGYSVATLKFTTEKKEKITKPVGILVADYSAVKESSQDETLDAFSVHAGNSYSTFTNAALRYEIRFDFDTDASTFDIRRYSGSLPISLEFGYDRNVKGRGFIQTCENKVRGNSYMTTAPGEYNVTLDFFTMTGEVFRHTVNITVNWKHGYTPTGAAASYRKLSFNQHDEVSFPLQREVHEGSIITTTPWEGGEITDIEITEGSLPEGMYVANSFLKPCGLYGTPVESGDFNVKLLVTSWHDTYTYNYKIHIEPAERLTGTVRLNGGDKQVGDILDFTLTDAPGEPYKYQWQWSSYETEWGDFKKGLNSTLYANSSYAHYYIRVKVTKDGYGGALYSDSRYINPAEDLSGNLYIVNNTSPGVQAFAGFTGLVDSIFKNEPDKLHFQWQISDDGTSGWSDIEGQTGTHYTPESSELGKFLRLTVTADGYTGSVISAPKEVAKLANYADPVMPLLLSESPYNAVVVTNAKADQEYLVTYSEAVPADWTGAEYPSADGSLSLSCDTDRTVYVYTRTRETEEKAAGTKTAYNKTYSGYVTYLVDLKLDKTSFKTRVGEVTSLTVSPLPEAFSGWDAYTVEWYVNGSEVELYADPECTIPVPTGSVEYKTVYVKGVTQTHSVTVGAEKQVGYSDIRIAQCAVEVADSEGNYVLQELVFDPVTTFPGETVYGSYTPVPSPANIGVLSFEKTSGPEGELIFKDNGDGSVTIDAPSDAQDGTWYYRVKVDGADTPVVSAIRVDIVSDLASVALNAENGMGETSQYMVALGSEFILPELPDSFTVPDGYVFDGWDMGDVGDGFNVGENMTVHARWIPHIHDIEAVSAVEPSCETAGNAAYYYCAACGKTFADQDGTVEASAESFVIPAPGHSTAFVAAKAVSCEENGHTEYYECSACGKWFRDSAATTEIVDYREVILEAPGHTWGAWTGKDDNVHVHICTVCSEEEAEDHQWDEGTVTKEATTSEEGIKTFTCGICGAEKTESIPRKVPVTYNIVSEGSTDGTAGKWIKGSSAGYEIVIKRSVDDDLCFSNFVSLSLDGKTLIQGSGYTAKAGSTVLTIKAGTLEQLKAGTYDVTAVFKDGEVRTKLTVAEKPAAPNTPSGSGSGTTPATGDTNKTALPVLLMAAALAGLAAAGYGLKRTRTRRN